MSSIVWPAGAVGYSQNMTVRRMSSVWFAPIFIAAVWWMAPACAAAAADIASYAFVRDDGTLKVEGKIIHLYGIHIPDAGTSCRTFIRPVRCGPRAALALDFKIGSHFVHCNRKGRREDGSIVAVCAVDDQDLSAYLLRKGWAVALPDAPIEYKTLEKIARHRGIGIWGIPIDSR